MNVGGRSQLREGNERMQEEGKGKKTAEVESK